MEVMKRGEAVPAPPQTLYASTSAALAQLSHEQGHYAASSAGRLALCAMALAVVVRAATKMPTGCPERDALAKAARQLREVVV